MTADVGRLALTDDEAAAIATRASGAWRAPLPTVDATSEVDLAAAVLRGWRSLVIRELAELGGTVTGGAAEVLNRLGTGACAAFMLEDGDGSWLPTGPHRLPVWAVPRTTSN